MSANGDMTSLSQLIAFAQTAHFHFTFVNNAYSKAICKLHFLVTTSFEQQC